ncbi:hypothetical protein [Streptomyces viridochromogenes]|uniref:hypothetical protein n=1 Tax=Streptomyces viridochromogenes TaxID=1938 RepID=UPI0002DBC097|nr:hypothetical protein [Streptomyces viridochromogenes]
MSPFIEAGKILALETDLFGFDTTGQRYRLARTTANLAYTPKITVHRVNLSFPLTSLQLHAIEEGRTGDVRFEIDLSATLPQAPGYPGSAQDTAHITIAKSRWEQQLAQLGPSAAFEMAVPYPLGDPERDEVGRTLRETRPQRPGTAYRPPHRRLLHLSSWGHRAHPPRPRPAPGQRQALRCFFHDRRDRCHGGHRRPARRL